MLNIVRTLNKGIVFIVNKLASITNLKEKMFVTFFHTNIKVSNKGSLTNYL